MTKAQHRKLLNRIIAQQQVAINEQRYAVAQLQNLLADLHNRSPVKPKRRTAPPTRLVKQKIVRLSHNGLSQQEVAQRLKISIGRVSETLRGKRR